MDSKITEWIDKTFADSITKAEMLATNTWQQHFDSEPQVMVICPKAEICKLEKHQSCFAPNHSIPHIKEGSCNSCSAYCLACIPVPPTPASHMKKISYCSVCQRETSFEDGYCLEHPNKTGGVGKPLPPDELLTNEETFNLGFKTSYRAESAELFAYSEGVNDGAKAQLLKCHQSEAHYEKKSHNQTIIIRECTKYIDDQKARIKELEGILDSIDFHNSESAIRADQNRKIATEMMSHVRAESGLPPRWVADLIDKLQKGDSPE